MMKQKGQTKPKEKDKPKAPTKALRIAKGDNTQGKPSFSWKK